MRRLSSTTGKKGMEWSERWRIRGTLIGPSKVEDEARIGRMVRMVSLETMFLQSKNYLGFLAFEEKGRS